MHTVNNQIVLKNIYKNFGSISALKDISMVTDAGKTHCILGDNGAGKSTAMKAVFGMLRLREGQVRLDSDDISHLSPQDRVAKGMGFVPQTNNIFTSIK